MPIAELALLIQVGQLIGVWWTILLLIADAMLGSWLLRAQGRAAWRRFNEALAGGRLPHREVIDGVLIIFGGALLLTPGFITDIFGLLFLIPPTRAVMRRLLVRRGMLKLVGVDARHGEPAERPPARHRGQRRGHRPSAPVSAADLEAPRALRKPGDTDAVTFSWADASAGLYGLARVAGGAGADGARVRQRARDRVRRSATRWARSPRPATSRRPS